MKSPGDIVAHAGNTGNSSGTHLHLEMIQCDLGMDMKMDMPKVLDTNYNRLHEKDGGDKNTDTAKLVFKGKDYYFKGNNGSDNWKDYRLNPLTGKKE